MEAIANVDCNELSDVVSKMVVNVFGSIKYVPEFDYLGDDREFVRLILTSNENPEDTAISKFWETSTFLKGMLALFVGINGEAHSDIFDKNLTIASMCGSVSTFFCGLVDAFLAQKDAKEG